ncbi:hypothetical protein INT47_001755 [Mucor saturninus]|uniref:MoaB/Mog domain-containing protein n=1 Tax=Mucor saturninus TaxID=64648 RepID=A0A8H7VFB3_9FUNG|nr:hypothetical protein INT47_001755 [Mucor saturninus]
MSNHFFEYKKKQGSYPEVCGGNTPLSLNMTKIITAGCCIIGDEILSGKTRDQNSHYLATTLFNVGIELKTIQVVGDNVQDITKSVRELSSQYDLVFTSGGIGPTHDDITYESIASAFNLEMKVDTGTYNFLEKQIANKGQTMTKHHVRMVTFPYPAELIREMVLPVVVVNKNVYILPGIPSLFKMLLDSIQPRLEKLSGSKFYRNEIATAASEVTMADILTAAQLKGNEYGIRVGSYPLWGKNPENIRVVVNVSGKDQSKVDELSKEITNDIKGWPYKQSRL